MHRFLLREGDIVDEKVFVVISEELRNQWMKVLRFRVGEKIVLFRDDGKEYTCEIASMSPKIIQGNVLSVRNCDTELPIKIILAQSILKSPEKFEWVLQKGTELGVGEFYPIITRRTERPTLHKFDRLQRILIEATEQCGRCVVPVLHEPIKFERFLKHVQTGSSLLVPHTIGGVPLQDVTFSKSGPVVVCIGPEGGFEDKEIEIVKSLSGQAITLGKRVLRSETASIVSLAQLLGRIE